MRLPPLVLPLLLVAAALPTLAQETAPVLRLSEIVADPVSDWNEDGRVTASDEYVEVFNAGPEAVDLAGWELRINDTSPQTLGLGGLIEPGRWLSFVNPPGETNLNGHVLLVSPAGAVADEVRYGNWPGNTAGVPSGASQGLLDESLRATPAGWSRGHATPGEANDAPRLVHVPPFETLPGGRWDPGNRSVRMQASWTDADRSYENATVELETGSGLSASTGPAVLEAGRWSATLDVVTPLDDFSYHWTLATVDGTRESRPDWQVRVDSEPPTAPLLDLPEWTNRASVTPVAGPATDAGVGGVQYRFERWNETDGWSPAGPWASSPQGEPVDVERPDGVLLRALARDAFNHTVAGPAQRLRFDGSPPPPVAGLEAEGYDTIRLWWTAPADPESGLAGFEVERGGDASPRRWSLTADTTEIVDDGFHLGSRLAYTVTPFDAAGNRGPATPFRPDYEGLHPHAKGLRVAKDVWGSGLQRIHADFDRRMDTEQIPRLTLESGDQRIALEGRWLSNASTFLVELEEEEAPPEGEAILTLEAAAGAHGDSLWAPLRASFGVDASVPELAGNDVEGWVGAAGLRLVAADAYDPEPSVHWRVGGSESPWSTAPREATVRAAHGTRVDAYASDGSGHRSRTRTLTLRVDSQAPTWQAQGWSGPGERATFRLSVQDEGSGLAQGSLRFQRADGTPIAPQRVGADGEVRLGRDAAGPVRILATDLVGNSLTADVRIPAAPADPPRPSPVVAPAPMPEPGPSPATSRQPEEAAPAGHESHSEPMAVAASPEPKRHAPWPAAAAVLAAAALVAALRVAFRRRPAPPSLARRVLELRQRADAAPTG